MTTEFSTDTAMDLRYPKCVWHHINWSLPEGGLTWLGKIIKGSIIWCSKCLYDLQENAVKITHELPWIFFFLASNHFTNPKNSSCKKWHWSGLKTWTAHPQLFTSIFLQAYFTSGAKTETYSFNNGLIYLESQIKLFHYTRKTHFFLYH